MTANVVFVTIGIFLALLFFASTLLHTLS